MFLGYVLEIILYESNDLITFETKFYLTHMDIAIGNTFITTSGFIILLLTIDRWDDCLENKKVTFRPIIKNIHYRYRAICHPTWSRDVTPGLSIFYALMCSVLLQVPRFWEHRIINKCIVVTLISNASLLGGFCDCSAAFPGM